MTPLPIDSEMARIVSAVREARSLVLVAPPGAGKTTRVPPAILRAGLLAGDHPNLIMLQPRRVAARAAAQRIAEENGWQLGQEVGYQIRFENHIGPATRLRVVTEGILTRQLLDDPFLDGIGAVVLDEFHERSLHADLAIALLREVRQTVREDLLLIVMSATLDAQAVAKFLGDCPIVQAPGRAYPVQIEYAHPLPFGRLRELPDHVALAVEMALPVINVHHVSEGAADGREDNQDTTDPGDILVFLPGVDEIRRTTSRLQAMADRHDLLLAPLHGSLGAAEQIAALRPAPRRKIILSTNIAETSLTIEGVRTVIDSGMARVAGYDAQRGLDRLELARISKASAAQRAGRAGRTAPGRCIRLWSAGDERAMSDFDTPEVHRVDLTAAVLSLHAWGKPDPRAFGWFDPPPEHALAAAERLLAMLGALTAETGGALTPIGRRLLSFPAHPRLARLLLAAAESGRLAEGAALAALLSEKDIVANQPRDHDAMFRPATQSDSDLLTRMELLARAEQDHFGPAARALGIDTAAARQAARARDEFVRLGSRFRSAPSKKSDGARGSQHALRGADDGLLQLPLLAYPDRVCRRRQSDPTSAAMVGGGGVRLAEESAVRTQEFFLALDARQDQRSLTREALVRIASAIDPAWLEDLFPQSIRRESGAVFDEARQRVVGFRAVYYRDLLLREDRNAAIDPEEAARVLAEALRPRAVEMFARDEEAADWLARLKLLRDAMPEHPWPEMTPERLADLLADAARGKRSVEEIERAGLAPLLRGTLAYPLDRLFEQHAPESIEVPTGNRIRLNYSAGPRPILAVRLQEIFGWTDTPRIADGRVRVIVHLLGPNFRPVQITDDLRSFWSDAYFQVRKDLRTRYPKHAWPEDPLTAAPQAKGSRRRS